MGTGESGTTGLGVGLRRQEPWWGSRTLVPNKGGWGSSPQGSLCRPHSDEAPLSAPGPAGLGAGLRSPCWFPAERGAGWDRLQSQGSRERPFGESQSPSQTQMGATLEGGVECSVLGCTAPRGL